VKSQICEHKRPIFALFEKLFVIIIIILLFFLYMMQNYKNILRNIVMHKASRYHLIISI